MNDNDLLELIADRAPSPPGDFAAGVLALGRRRRRQRRLRVAVAGVAGVLVAAVAAPVVGGNLFDRPADKSVTALSTPSGSPTASPSAPAATTDVLIYRAAISAILTEAMPAAEIAEYAVLDHLCGNLLTPTEPCASQPLPAPVRTSLENDPYVQVHFVPDLQDVRHPLILVTLGPIKQVGDGVAEVPMSFHQGENGQGLTYRIKREANEWHVIGTTGGPEWIN